ncbi:phage tail protein I [Methylobacterium sp. SyP6R]|uniref:phage tail protein I n=1 Tax=Methylobacterium sp. SyP6R TaxID=2718876 RepID=UPI001EFF844D|nr:phage tail protein I [Methylobacterium sp. SyP6R]MCF4125047.1 phage tail protein I [Methylobacterium sp. SyP6R]
MADFDDVLPGDATPLERAIADADARLDAIDTDLVRRIGGPRIAEVPEPYLSRRAWARSVDVYDPAWPEAIRRAVIEVAPAVHIIKGALDATTLALAALRVETVITEWFEANPPAKPYTVDILALARAKLYADGPVLDDRLLKAVFDTVMRTKPLSRGFRLRVGVALETGLGLAPAAVAVSRVAVSADAILPMPPAAASLGLAPAAAAVSRVAVSADAALPMPPIGAVLGLAPAAAARVRVTFTAHAG